MAFRLTCDVETCRAEIQSSETGQPCLPGKQNTYCDRCAGYIAAVDLEMQREMNLRSFALAEELNALRQERIAKALPQQLGGAGHTPGWVIEVPK